MAGAAACWVVGALADGVWRAARRTAAVAGAQVRWKRGGAPARGAGDRLGVPRGACDYAALRWKDGIPVLAADGWRLLRLIGVSAGSQGGMVDLTTMAGPLEFAASIDRLGLRLPVLFLAYGAVWLVWSETADARRCCASSGWSPAILLAVAVVPHRLPVAAGPRVVRFRRLRERGTAVPAVHGRSDRGLDLSAVPAGGRGVVRALFRHRRPGCDAAVRDSARCVRWAAIPRHAGGLRHRRLGTAGHAENRQARHQRAIMPNGRAPTGPTTATGMAPTPAITTPASSGCSGCSIR